MRVVYQDISEYNPKEHKILIVFDYMMIANTIRTKTLNPNVTEHLILH